MDLRKYRIFDGTGGHQLNLYNVKDTVMGRNGKLTLIDDNIKPEIIRANAGYPLNLGVSYDMIGNMCIPRYQLPQFPTDFERFSIILISRVLAGALNYCGEMLDFRLKDRLFVENTVFNQNGYVVGMVGVIPLFPPQHVDTYLQAPYNRALSKAAVERCLYDYEQKIQYSIDPNEQDKLWQLKQLLANL